MFIISAFIIGLLVALNPCQLAINLSALTYLNNRSDKQHPLMSKGLLYIIGRSITYSILGIILSILLDHLHLQVVKGYLFHKAVRPETRAAAACNCLPSP